MKPRPPRYKTRKRQTPPRGTQRDELRAVLVHAHQGCKAEYLFQQQYIAREVGDGPAVPRTIVKCGSCGAYLIADDRELVS